MKAHGIGPEALVNLTRLYWYTVEFGLIKQDDGLRIYGSGIVSSKGESIHCLESAAPNRIGFDLERIMRTRYRIDTYQKTYFVIDSYEQLMEATQPDFTPIYAQPRRSRTSIPGGRTCWTPTRCSTAARAKAGSTTATSDGVRRLGQCAASLRRRRLRPVAGFLEVAQVRRIDVAGRAARFDRDDFEFVRAWRVRGRVAASQSV